MSEYVMIESEPTADPDIMELHINQTLTRDEREHYPDPESGEIGSPLAQTLFLAVDGIHALTIFPDYLVIRRQPGTDWMMILDDVRDALRDFFL